MNIDTDLIYNDKESERRRQQRKRRREERRKRSSGKRKVISFLWGAKELSPIISKTISDNGTLDYDKIAQQVKAQESLLDDVIEGLGGSGTHNETFQLRAGIASSQLVSTHNNISPDSLSRCIALLSQANDHKSDLIEQIDMGVFSSDALVNIKLQLLPGLYDFYSSITTLTNDRSIAEEYTSWLSNSATELAKDVSFNWDKKSSYRDRETLFVCMLPTCIDICISAFYEYLAKFNGASRIINDDAPINVKFPLLHGVIHDLDMGYEAHPEKDMSWLESTLLSILNDRIPIIKIPKSQEMYYNRIMGSIISDIDSIASECWKKEAEYLINKIQKEISDLSDDEAEAIMMEKYSDPMSLEGFTSALIAKLDRWPGIINPIDTDLNHVSNIAEQKMAALWGLTEAVCQIRSDKK